MLNARSFQQTSNSSLALLELGALGKRKIDEKEAGTVCVHDN
jgi:hypothetical protein